MNLLLDTCTFLWYVTGDNSLSATASVLISDPNNTSYVSIATIWEMAIKSRTGKLEIPSPFAQFIDTALLSNSFRIRNISISHLKRVADLPLIHRDPFDRLLIAQSQVEGLPVITNDAAFNRYQVQRIW